jgi:Amt family ammonium transporter
MKRAFIAGLGAAAAILASSATAWAASSAPAAVESGQVAWMLTASALVLFMTLPGLGLFYGGLVHAKNVLSVLMQCFAICAIASVIWVICGYSLAFDGTGALIGGLGKAFLGEAAITVLPNGLPENVFALFQMTFAVITPALIVGAFPERATFPFVAIFSAAWLLVVYAPIAHWVWGGGWLAGLGVMDFAGGIVVHTSAGVAAVVAALMIGERRGFRTTMTPPHSPGMTMAGAGMLWVGWFGFNGGSALAADATAGGAILATHLAASAGAMAWTAAEWIKLKKPTSIGIVTGCVAGLATITPAAGYVSPAAAMAIGAGGGLVCFAVTVFVKQRLRVDDSLDVFAVHGIGGMAGSLAVAVAALPVLGGAGLAAQQGWLHQLGVQALAVVVAALWSGVATWLIVKAIGAVTALRVGAQEEFEGLDISIHGERAYEYE